MGEKVKFSRAFVGRFLGRYMLSIVPWLTLVAVFEVYAAWSLSSQVNFAVRAAYLLLAAQWLRPRTEVWQRENGNMNGDRSILRAFSTSMTVAGGMCALYALEDYTGQSIVPNI